MAEVASAAEDGLAGGSRAGPAAVDTRLAVWARRRRLVAAGAEQADSEALAGLEEAALAASEAEVGLALRWRLLGLLWLAVRCSLRLLAGRTCTWRRRRKAAGTVVLDSEAEEEPLAQD